MDHGIRYGRRHGRPAARASGALAVFLLALCLYFVPHCAAATEKGQGMTFEDRAAAEKMSRSRYRDLEVASLIIILVVGGGAILWAVRRRNPKE